tara:strand:- start:318 stop:569 length:252 start_codon:yes stop_codon:yes gene_type:complete
MSLGKWLNNLSTLDHVVLLIIFFIGILLSRVSLKELIKYYEKKTNYSEYRQQFRVTPFSLLSLGFLYTFMIYKLLSNLFSFMP